jgi:hypothetical protein
MTASQEHQTTEFGPWNTGISRWRKQKREGRTLLVEQFLTQHGSTRLCSGLITYEKKVRFTCSQCGQEATSRWKDLINRDRVWCKSCATKERMKGVIPSQKMLEAAAIKNAQLTKARREARFLKAFDLPIEQRSVRAQVKILSPKWPPDDWAVAMNTAVRIFQRCTNPRSSNFIYYGGRGVEVKFPSSAILADWILTNLGPRPQGSSIDRIDVNGHYEQGNLRWATFIEQMNNRNSCRHMT